MQISKSLQVQEPWASLILNGEKTVETSGQACTGSGIAPGWVLLRTGSGTAAGAAHLGPRITYNSAAEFDAHVDRHLVPPTSRFHHSQRKRGRSYGYPVDDVIVFDSPMLVTTPSGQNRLKTVDDVEVI
jgi:hypothetical protein